MVLVPLVECREREDGEVMTSTDPAPSVHFDRVPWKRVGLFMLLSYGLFLPFAAPFWFLDGGIHHPLYVPVIAVGMWMPAVASLILAKRVEKTSWRTRVGLRFRGRGKRLLVWIPLALVVTAAIQVLCAVIMVLRGVPGDLSLRTGITLYAETLSQQTQTDIPVGIAAALLAVNAVFGLVVTLLFTLGEEIGWRGWLWPALKPLGRVRAAVVGGAIWSFWHLPIVLIGHNYPGWNRAAALAMFLPACMAMFWLFGAFTDRAAGNPIPAAVAHAVVNSWGTIAIILVSTAATGAAVNLGLDTMVGLTGIVLLVIAGIVIMPRRRRSRTAAVNQGTAESTPG